MTVSLAQTLSLLAFGLQGCGGASPPAPSPARSPAPSPAPSSPPEFDTKWQGVISGSSCVDTQLSSKDGKDGALLACKSSGGIRAFRFPAGTFDIDRQVEVPANTHIEGSASPIPNPANKMEAADPRTQTRFVATKGVTNYSSPYCGTDNNMRQGDAQRLRIGFLMNSNTSVRNINFQGKDTTRPSDNGNLCGGGAFETPGCVSPGFGDGKGDGWQGKTGCFDHTGKANALITGTGRGVDNVVIDSVRLNHVVPLPANDSGLLFAPASQLAVWVPMTQDGSPTTNVKVSNLVSATTKADGINLHGNVQRSTVEDCHCENTGDDIYAFWGAYSANPTETVFRNNVGKNPGVSRGPYKYGLCVAVYGAKSVTITGTRCYDLKAGAWNPGQVPSGDDLCPNGPFCNSCLAYVHDGWFGAVYPDGNVITLTNNSYYDMVTGDAITDRPKVRSDKGSKANIVTDGPSVAMYI